MIYLATWNKSIRVKVLDDNVEIRTAHRLKQRGILYKRMDSDEPSTVRSYGEFMNLFKREK